MTVSAISVPDMHCSACSSKIRAALAHHDGIEATYINPARRHVLIEHQPDLAAIDILREIEAAGFNPTLTAVEDSDARQRLLLKRLGIAGLAMMQVMMTSFALYAGEPGSMTPEIRRLLEFTSLLFCIPVVAYSAMPFFTSALTALRRGVNMDVPVALAIVIAFAASVAATLRGEGAVYYDSVVMFTFLLLGARFVDLRLRQQFTSTGQVLQALPRTAVRVNGTQHESIDLEHIAVGDLVWVAQGEQVPVDGALMAAAALLDEAVLSGESEAVAKTADARLWAGSINRGAAFTMRAHSTCDNSRICDIAALADKAMLDRAPTTLMADRIAGYFIPAILLLALVTFLCWQLFDPARAFVAALTVLVVSCPCALSLATPAAVTAAMTRLRRKGVVLTRSAALEQAAGVNRALIDKTGTLTIHEPTIREVTVLNSAYSASQCRALAGALQKFSGHPYARAFADGAGIVIDAPRPITGQGMTGFWQGREVRLGNAVFCNKGRSSFCHGPADESIYLSVDGQPCARFKLSDDVRADAKAALDQLKALGVDSIMVSGDAPARCAALAQVLDIKFLARQTPESKLAYLKASRATGDVLLMLGDGINDIPVLAAADVSAAVVEASDLVKSKADVLLLTRRLLPLVELVRTARKTRKITRQNLAWALLYNLTAIPIAALGLMPAWLAAAGMAASSTLVMLNATRILRTS